MICISCNNEHNEKFCPNCGEKSEVKKITLTSIIEEAFSTITNMDKGFLYNIKSLFKNPKEFTADYISGKRKGILNPISFLIISISIYLIIETFFKVPVEVDEPVVHSVIYSKGYLIGQSAGEFIYSYSKYFFMFLIFPLANSTKLVFQKYNYMEHIVISSFIIGLATLISIITFLFFKPPLVFNPILYIILFYLIYKIFKNQGEFNYLLTLVSLFLFIFQISIIILTVGIVMSYFN